MNLATPDTKLSDIIINEPNVVTVFNRFGISLGVGDHTIATACQKYSLDKEFVLSIINTFVSEDYFPETTLMTINIASIVSYLEKTNDYYTRFLIPNIERHFGLLISKTESTTSNLQLMMQFFGQLKSELCTRISNDSRELFPALLAHSPQDINIEESTSIEEKLGDLKNLFIIHLKGEYDANLCHAVLLAIVNLEKDFKQNDRIRQRILYPYTLANNE